MSPKKFQVPRGVHLVFLTPPGCATSGINHGKLMQDRDMVREILKPETVRVKDSYGVEYFIHHRSSGETANDAELTFRHTTGLKGIYALPLHPDVFVVPKRVNNSPSSLLKVLAASSGYRAMQTPTKRSHTKPEQQNQVKRWKLSDLLKRLPGGTYVVEACRVCPRNGNSIMHVQAAYKNEVDNFVSKLAKHTGTPRHAIEANARTRKAKPRGHIDYFKTMFTENHKRVQDAINQYKTIRERLEASKFVPNSHVLRELLRNNPPLKK